jgi:hypothetical protein
VDDAIATGLQALAARFKHHPSITQISGHVWQTKTTTESDDEQDHVEYWHKMYPALNVETAEYLFKFSDNYFQIPCFFMFAIGDYFVSQSWTDEELKAHVEGMKDMPGVLCGVKDVPWPKATCALTCKKRAKLVAKLVYDVLNYTNACGESVNIEELKNVANDIKMLPLSELLMSMKQSRIVVAADQGNKEHKAALIVTFVEHLFNDVIDAAESEK